MLYITNLATCFAVPMLPLWMGVLHLLFFEKMPPKMMMIIIIIIMITECRNNNNNNNNNNNTSNISSMTKIIIKITLFIECGT
jgi:hypothetical protein